MEQATIAREDGNCSLTVLSYILYVHFTSTQAQRADGHYVIWRHLYICTMYSVQVQFIMHFTGYYTGSALISLGGLRPFTCLTRWRRGEGGEGKGLFCSLCTLCCCWECDAVMIVSPFQRVMQAAGLYSVVTVRHFERT